MASILKKKILKHLSKFTKNFSPDQLLLNAIKGVGELSNLDINEKVLESVLELPTWLKITSASCNRVVIKIQWLKIKSEPIRLYLDEVVVEMETRDAEQFKTQTASRSTHSTGGNYGFIDCVMDGIYVDINSVIIKIVSPKFKASLELTRLVVHSTTPHWTVTNDLHKTRIKDSSRGEILLFKEVDWQATRIEAAADDSLAEECLTPLRLIANHAKIRIILKKRVCDGFIIFSRLTLLLDDLLWVLTVTQLKSAIIYANSLKNLVQKSSEESKKTMADELSRQADPLGQRQKLLIPESTHGSVASCLFERFNITTTSYHFLTCRFDLHLCDDTSNTPGGDRKGWLSYSNTVSGRSDWVDSLYSSFRRDAVKLINVLDRQTSSSGTLGIKIASSGVEGVARTPPIERRASNAVSPSSHPPKSPHSKHQPNSLLESCFVMKVADLMIYMVSTPVLKQTSRRKFIVSDKKRLKRLGDDMSVLHIEYSEYYFPNFLSHYPVPHPNLYVLLNPIHVTVDFLTLLWLEYFMITLSQCVKMNVEVNPPSEHIDVKIEASMLRVRVHSEMDREHHPEWPSGLQVQASGMVASNRRVDRHLRRDDLRNSLQAYYQCHLFRSMNFPSDTSQHCCYESWHLDSHAHRQDNPYVDKVVKELLESDEDGTKMPERNGELISCHTLHRNSLKMEGVADVWGVHFEQVWLDFVGVKSSRSHSVQFVEAFPLTLWFSPPISTPQLPSSSPLSGSLQPASSFTSHPSSSLPSCSISCSQSSLPCSSPLSPPSTSTPHPASTFSPHPLCTFSSHLPSVSSSHPPLIGGCLEFEGQDIRPLYAPCAGSASHHRRQTRQGISGSSVDMYLSTLTAESNDQEQPKGGRFFILPDIGMKVRVQINQCQYLFLLYLTETCSSFLCERETQIASLRQASALTIYLPLCLDNLLIAVICPYQMQLQTFPEDFSPSLSNLTAVFETKNGSWCGDDVETGHVQLSSLPPSVPHGADDELKESGVSNLGNCETTSHAENKSNNWSVTDLAGNSHDSSRLTGVDVSITHHLPVEYHVSPTLLGTKMCPASKSSGLDTGTDLDMGFPKACNICKESTFSNLTNKLKDVRDDLVVTDDVDSLSMKTDTSDDDDFEFFSFEVADELPAFSRQKTNFVSNVDGESDGDAVSVCEDTSTTKGKEMAFLLLFRLQGMEAVVQFDDSEKVISGQLSQVQVHQLGNIGYDDFYDKFLSGKEFISGENAPLADSTEKYPFRFKYKIPTKQSSSQPSMPVEKQDILSDMSGQQETQSTVTTEPVLIATLDDYSFNLKKSGLTCLSDFLADEKKLTAMPFEITISNVLLIFHDDRPATANNCGSLPLNCYVEHLLVRRGADGVLHMLSRGSTPCEETHMRPDSLFQSSVAALTQTQAENNQLQRHCDELNRANRLYEDEILKLRDQLMQLKHQISPFNRDIKSASKISEAECAQRIDAHSASDASASASSLHGWCQDGYQVSMVEAENIKLQQQIFQLEDQTQTLTIEKQSFISMLNILQEELLHSEQNLQRKSIN